MHPKTIVGLVLLFVGSLAIGWKAGSWGYGLFIKTVPAGSITDLVRSGTKGAYVTSGLVLGLVIFAWTALAAWATRFFRGGESRPSTAPTPTAADGPGTRTARRTGWRKS